MNNKNDGNNKTKNNINSANRVLQERALVGVVDAAYATVVGCRSCCVCGRNGDVEASVGALSGD